MKDTGGVRVLVVDDRPVFREKLVSKLADSEHIGFVTSVCSTYLAERLIAICHPDVVITNTKVSGANMLPWMKRIKATNTGVSVVFLTNQGDERSVMHAIAAGADGYIYEDAPMERIIDAIVFAYRGQSLFDPRLTASILRKLSIRFYDFDQYPPTQPVRLSQREREVVELVVQGLTNSEIAKAMYVSENTIKTHLRRIFERVGVSSRRQLMHLYNTK